MANCSNIILQQHALEETLYDEEGDFWKAIEIQSRINFKIQLNFVLEKFKTINLTDNPDDVVKNFRPLELQKNIKYLQENPESYATVVDIYQSFKNILYVLSPDHGYMEVREKVINYINNLKRIGEESNYGYVMIGDVNNTSEVFAIKVPNKNDEDTVNETIHELFVGMNYLNNLRPLIPNFMFTYGMFYCTPPVFDKNKKVINMCATVDYYQKNGKKYDAKVPYVIIENINNAVSLTDYLQTCSLSEFISVFSQIIFSLKTAQYNEKYGYTHYDLHPGNVLIRNIKNKKNFYIKYMFNDIKYNVKSDNIATIIDYGKSVVKIDNKIYQSYGANPSFMYAYGDRIYPLFDVFKFLLMCSTILIHRKDYDFGKFLANMYVFFCPVETLYSYFLNSEKEKLTNLYDAVDKLRDVYYYLPDIAPYNTLKLDDFVKHMVLYHDNLKFNIIKKDLDNADLLLIPTFNNTLSTFNANNDLTTTQPNNFEEFYNMVKYIAKTTSVLNTHNMYDIFKKKYENKKASFLKKLSVDDLDLSFVDLIKRLIALYQPMYVAKTTPINSDGEFLELIKDIYLILYKNLFMIEKQKVNVKIGRFVADEFNDDKLKQMIQLFDKTLNDYLNKSCSSVTNFVDIVLFVQDVSKENSELGIWYNSIENLEILKDIYCNKDNKLYTMIYKYEGYDKEYYQKEYLEVKEYLENKIKNVAERYQQKKMSSSSKNKLINKYKEQLLEAKERKDKIFA